MSIKEIIDQILAICRSAWRFRWQGIGAAWLMCVIGWVGVAWMPDVYEARARVFVDTSSVLRPILSNRIVPLEVATELSYVRQALLGREHLERVVAENQLDVDLETEADRETLLTLLRTDIQILSRDNTNTVYNINYRNSDRDKAIGVVRTLLNSLVETTLGASREDTDTAERFLEARIREYESRLQEAEFARAEFKKRNADRLPGSEGGYFERIRAESIALEESRKSLRLSQARRDRLLSQLAGESPVVPTAGTPSVEPTPNSLDARIREYRTQLDMLLLQYTDKHPDVINAREALASLERQRREQLSALGVDDPDLELSSIESNPIYQATRIALNEIEVEIEALEADVAEREDKLRDLQALINEVPEVEAELARLNRDYDVVYEQYQGLVRSRETQELSRKAADTEEVQFRVIDPPLADFRPVAPNRLLLLTAVFVASIGAGGGLMWLLAQLRPVFSSVAQLRALTGLPILGAVTEVFDGRVRVRRLLSVLAFGGAFVVLCGLFLAAAAFEALGPGVHSLVTSIVGPA